MYNGVGKFMVLVVTGLMLVGLLACGALGMSALAFQIGQSQGYATGVIQAGGEGAAPMPYGYPGSHSGMLFMPLMCCGGFLLLLLVPILMLPLKAVACAGGHSRHWRRRWTRGAPWPDDDAPEEVREYMKQHFKHGPPCPPGPWMFRYGMRGHRRHGSWWTDEEMPDEVKQWFHQHFGCRTEEQPPRPEEAPVEEPPAKESPAEETE